MNSRREGAGHGTTVARIGVGLLCACAVLTTSDATAQGALARMAYTSEYYYLLDCDAGCILDLYPGAVANGVGFWGFQPTWSPDGLRLAVTISDTSAGFSLAWANIFVVPTTGGEYVQLTHATERSIFFGPAWSPDGTWIAFLHSTSGGLELGVMNPDGSGMQALSNIASWGQGVWAGDRPTWSPDSARIAFTCVVELNNLDICVVNRDGTNLVRLTNDAAADSSPVWSPDGTRIAFATERFGGGAVLALMNSDGGAVSHIGTSIPGWPGSWSTDGARIAFTADGDPQCLPIGGLGGSGCGWYIPHAIYTTTPDGAVITRLVNWATDPAWMPAQPESGPPSPDKTRLPPASRIVDDSGAVWTMDGVSILRNGQPVGIGTTIAWCGSRIYVLGTDNNWWRWTSDWVRSGTVDPCGSPTPLPPGGTSPDGTRLPPAPQIVDDSGGVWTMDGVSILRNGQPIGIGTIITWCGSRIYVLGTDNNWWLWTDDWVRSGTVTPCGS